MRLNRSFPVLIFSIVASLLLVGGCGKSQQSSKKENEIVVGLAWNEKMHSLIQAWEDYLKQYSAEYGKEKGVTFKWITNVADSDPSQQASNIEDLISQGVDIIVARAQDAAAIGASVRAAREAGSKFVTFDRPSSTVKPDAHVGADSRDQAISTGRKFAELLKAKGIKGKCIELMGDLRDMNAVQRSEGWHIVEKELGQWETIVQVPTEWNPEKFMTGTANALEAHPEANCMFIASDFCFSAVETALKNAGKLKPAGEEGHIWIAAQDVNPQGYNAMKKGYIDVATSYDAYYHAVKCVEVIYRLIQGEDLRGKSFLIAGRVATPETVDKLDHMWARDYKD